MKPLMTLAAIIVCLFMMQKAAAQTVNRVKLSDIRVTYLEVSAHRTSGKTWIRLDYGQDTDDRRNTFIKDDTGKEMEFNSALDFVNKMESYGYQLFQVIYNGTDPLKKYYILKRK